VAPILSITNYKTYKYNVSLFGRCDENCMKSLIHINIVLCYLNDYEKKHGQQKETEHTQKKEKNNYYCSHWYQWIENIVRPTLLIDHLKFAEYLNCVFYVTAIICLFCTAAYCAVYNELC